MFKKLVAIILTAMMVLSSFTMVTAAETETQTAAEPSMTYIAEFFAAEDYANAAAADGKNIAAAYTENTVTGDGWESNWSTIPGEYQAPADTDYIKMHRKTLYETSGGSSKSYSVLNLVPGKVYRRFANPISFDKDGTYVFAVDVTSGYSNAESRTSFRFDVGGIFSFGFNHELTAADAKAEVPSYAIPVIEARAASKVSDTKLTIGGGGNGEFVTYKAYVTVDADGKDKITLTAQDRQTWQHKDVWTNVSTERVVIELEADLSGNASYICFRGPNDTTTSMHIHNIVISGADVLLDNAYVTQATETFTDDDYASYKDVDGDPTTTHNNAPAGSGLEYLTIGNNIAASYYETENGNSLITGDGWLGNWSTEPDRYVQPLDANKIIIQRYIHKETASGGQAQQKMLLVDGTAPAYRQMKTPISFDADASYTFSVDVKSGRTTASTRVPFRFEVGDVFSFGYDVEQIENHTNTTEGYAVPFISVAGSEDTPDEKIIIAGGGDNGEFATLKVNVEVDADGTDTITLTLQDRQNWQIAGAWTNGYVTADIATYVVETELSGTANYIGFPKETIAFIQNVTVQGGRVPDYPVILDFAGETFETDEYKSSSTETVIYLTEGVTGSGWANNWSVTKDKYTEHTSTNIRIQDPTLYETSGGTSDKKLALETKGVTTYRELFSPVDFDKDGVYTFSADVRHAYSVPKTRENFRFEVGDAFSFGFNTEYTEGEDTVSYSEPVIEVGGKTAAASKKLKTGGGSMAPDFVTYKATVVVDADGLDMITLTAQDRQTWQNSAVWASTFESDASTVSIVTELSGKAGVIGFTNGASAGPAVQLQNIYINGEAPEYNVTTAELNVAIEGASEAFTDEEYPSYKDLDGNTETSYEGRTDGKELTIGENIAVVYGTDKVTGSGWANNWSSTAESFTTPVTDDKIELNRAFLRETSTSGNVWKKYLAVGADSITSKAYRQLKTPISFDKDGEYTFSVDVMSNYSYAEDRLPFRFEIGDVFSFGFDTELTAPDATERVLCYALPVIAAGNISAYAEAPLTMGGGEYNPDFTTYTATVKVDADGLDMITLRAQDRQSWQTEAAWTTVSSDISTISLVTELSGKVSYVGFAGKDGADTMSAIQNVSISGNTVYESAAADVNTYILGASETFTDEEYPSYKDLDGDPTTTHKSAPADSGLEYLTIGENIATTYGIDKVTGSGWANNWSSTAESFNAPTGKNVVLNREQLAEKNDGTTGAYKKFIGLSDGVIYRQLKAPISFDKDGVYTFSADVMSGVTKAKDRGTFRFNVGGIFSFGYNNDITGVDIEADDDAASNAYPVISAGGDTKVADTSLKMGGALGAGLGEFTTYTATVEVNANGADKITLTAQDRQSYQKKAVWEGNRISTDIVTVELITELSGTASYIGFENESGVGTHALVQNIAIDGKTADYEIATGELVANILGASDTFEKDEYKSAAVNASYLINGIPGSGWADKWSAAKDRYTEPTSTNLSIQNPALYETSESTSVVYKQSLETKGVLTYRELLSPVDFDKDGVYTFSADVRHANSDASLRTNFRFEVGDAFSFGFNSEYTETGEVASYSVPVIEVGGKTAAASKKLKTGGGKYAPDFVTYKATVVVDADGADMITLTAQDRQTWQDSAVWASTFETAASTVSIVTELSGKAGVIGFTNGASAGPAVQIQNIAIDGKVAEYDAYDIDYVLPEIASDTFERESGYANAVNGSVISTAYDHADDYSEDAPSYKLAGKGFGSNWVTTPDGDIATGEKITWYLEAKGDRVEDVATYGIWAYTNDASYRRLATPIATKDKNGVYKFKFDVYEGITSSMADRVDFRYYIGDGITVGYDWVKDEAGLATNVVEPGIYIGGKKIANGTVPTYGGGNGEYVTFELDIHLSSEGDDTLILNVYDRVRNNKIGYGTETVTITATGALTEKIAYIGFGAAEGATRTSNKRIQNIKIAGVDYDSSAAEVEQYITQMNKGYESARIIDTRVLPEVKSQLSAEFNKYGIAYDDFESQAIKVGSEKFDATAFNGGAGWDGSWTGDGNLSVVENLKESGKYDLKAETTPLNISRKLVTPINLGVDGEYYVKVSAYMACSLEDTVNAHSFKIAVGDIVFGTNGQFKSAETTAVKQAQVLTTFATDGNAVVTDENTTYTGQAYNQYILRIVSKASGDDAVEYYFVTDGVIDTEEPVAAASIQSDASIDTITLTNGTQASGILISEVAVDCWNDSITAKDLSMYDKVTDGSKFTYYSDYIKEVADVSLMECVTTDYYQGLKRFKGIGIDKVELINDGKVIDDISDLNNSDVRGVTVKTTYLNTGIFEYSDSQGKWLNYYPVEHMVAFYYDGKLMGLKRYGAQVTAHALTTTGDGSGLSYEFPTAHGWPQNVIDYSKVDIKIYSFAYGTFNPMEYVYEIYNSRTTVDNAERIYVNSAYTGDAASDGSEAAPYTTIDAAVKQIALMNRQNIYPENGVTIEVKGDHIYTGEAANDLLDLQVFDAATQYSGTEAAPVTIRGIDGARIIGGIKLDLSKFTDVAAGDAVTREGVKKYTVPTDVYTFDKELKIGGHASAYYEDRYHDNYYTLIFNESLMTPARFPNKDEDGNDVYMLVDELISDGYKGTSQRSGGSADGIVFTAKLADGTAVDESRWASDANMAVHGYFSTDFSDLFSPASINANGQIATTYNCGKYVPKEPTAGYNSRRFYVTNAASELDAEGEWYIDTATNTVYFMPIDGAASGEIIISTNDYPTVRTHETDYIRFEDITFVGGLNQAISVNNGTGIKISGCTMKAPGGYGIYSTGLINSEFSDNIVEYPGYGGIHLSGGSKADGIVGGNIATNNLVHHIGQTQKTYTPAFGIGGCGNTLSYNTIYNSAHTAIVMSGNDNIVEYNDISDVVRESADVGAIYMGKNKSHRGNEIRYNYFHDLKTSSKLADGIDAIFADDISDGLNIHHNIFKNITGGAFRSNGGGRMTIKNNVFLNVSKNAAFGRISQDNTYYLNDVLLADPIIASLKETGVLNSNYKDYPHLADLFTEDMDEDGNPEPIEAKYNVFKDNHTDGYGSDYILSDNAGATAEERLAHFVKFGGEFTSSAVITDLTKINANNYSDYGITFASIGYKSK